VGSEDKDGRPALLSEADDIIVPPRPSASLFRSPPTHLHPPDISIPRPQSRAAQTPDISIKRVPRGEADYPEITLIRATGHIAVGTAPAIARMLDPNEQLRLESLKK
jgi:hypothetical protein